MLLHLSHAISSHSEASVTYQHHIIEMTMSHHQSYHLHCCPTSTYLLIFIQLSKILACYTKLLLRHSHNTLYNCGYASTLSRTNLVKSCTTHSLWTMYNKHKMGQWDTIFTLLSDVAALMLDLLVMLGFYHTHSNDEGCDPESGCLSSP